MSGRVRAACLTGLVLVLSLLASLVAVPASAAPAGTVPDPSALTAEQWPADLKWAVQGTDEYKQIFKQDGCTSPNIGHFTQSWILQAPKILGALQNSTGKEVMAQFPGLTNGKAPELTWDAGSSMKYVKKDGKVWDLGAPLHFRDPANPFNELGDGQWPCFESISQFSKGVGADGTVTWFPSVNAAMPWKTTTGGTGLDADAASPPADFWWKFSGRTLPAGHQETGDDFKVSEGEFCDAEGVNPLCLTATFLQCPAATEGTLPEGEAADQLKALPKEQWAAKSAAMNCLIWNHNVLQYNAWLKYHLIESVNSSGAAHDSPNWDYASLILSAKQFQAGQDQVIVIAWIAAAIGVAAGVLITGGGLLSAILGLGLLAVTAAGAWDEVWGTVVCSSDLGKCMGKLSAQGLAFGADMIASTATSVQAPQLTNASAVFNTLAGISGMVMLVMLLLGICWAVFTGKFGQILQLSFGLVRWGLAIGIGATVLTMAFSLSDQIANTIAGTGGTDFAVKEFTNEIATSAMNLGLIEGFIGWLFVIIAAILGIVASLIVWVVLNVSYGFIGLAVALMILQMAGTTGAAGVQKWVARGWGLFWTLLLLKPAIVLTSRMVPLSGQDDPLWTMVTGVALLVVCALAPMLIVSMFPVMAAGGLGVLGAMANARQAAGLAGGAWSGAKAGASMIGGMARSDAVQSMLAAIRPGGSGGGDSGGAAATVPTSPQKNNTSGVNKAEGPGSATGAKSETGSGGAEPKTSRLDGAAKPGTGSPETAVPTAGGSEQQQPGGQESPGAALATGTAPSNGQPVSADAAPEGQPAGGGAPGNGGQAWSATGSQGSGPGNGRPEQGSPVRAPGSGQPGAGNGSVPGRGGERSGSDPTSPRSVVQGAPPASGAGPAASRPAPVPAPVPAPMPSEQSGNSEQAAGVGRVGPASTEGAVADVSPSEPVEHRAMPRWESTESADLDSRGDLL